MKELINFLKEFYGTLYGTIISNALEKEPNKYKTRIITKKGEIKGILAYKNKLNRISAKILAGDQSTLEELLKGINHAEIIIPSGLTDYLTTLKKIGFTQSSKEYSNNLKEYLLKMNYYSEL